MRDDSFKTALRYVTHALRSVDRPLLAQLVVIRRCNLSCGYCNEFDKASQPIPFTALRDRIKRLSDLGTLAVTFSGGEPLLHPDIVKIVDGAEKDGMETCVLTNGYLLTKDLIASLNTAGLTRLQISIDNLRPNEASAKSLSVLDRKLRLLADHARFKININTVLGASEEQAEDALVITRRAKEYGFTCSVGLLHNASGTTVPFSSREKEIYEQLGRLSGSINHRLLKWMYQGRLMDGLRLNWKCRAGARFLYICEDGRVRWCSQQRGYPGIPLSEYTVEDIRREFATEKNCSTYCGINCVQLSSYLDRWRGPQRHPDPTSRQDNV